MVWFDPDLPVLRIHLNNTGPLLGLQHVAAVPGSVPQSYSMGYSELLAIAGQQVSKIGKAAK